MERRVAAMVFMLAFAVASASRAPAGDAGTADPGNFPVELRVGESFDMCGSGEIACPARTAICDDPKVAVPADLPGGLGFTGVSPGTTLCSAASAAGPRRVFRITVR